MLKGITEPQDLKQVIEAPRRITDHSESLIDVCFTNAQHKVIECDVVDSGLSDHSLIYCLAQRSLPTPRKAIEFRPFKHYDGVSFVSDPSQVPWHVALNNHEDIDDCVDTWSKLFSEVAEAHAPIRTSRARGFSIPSLNPHITELMNKRNYHLKKARGNKCSAHWRLYRDLRNKSHPKHREGKIR